MKKVNCTLTGKLYEVKRQYPVFGEFSKRMHQVKKELNKENPCKPLC